MTTNKKRKFSRLGAWIVLCAAGIPIAFCVGMFPDMPKWVVLVPLVPIMASSVALLWSATYDIVFPDPNSYYP